MNEIWNRWYFSLSFSYEKSVFGLQRLNHFVGIMPDRRLKNAHARFQVPTLGTEDKYMRFLRFVLR
jgi:hypothetical protein